MIVAIFLALLSFVSAAIPALLFLRNRSLYTAPPVSPSNLSAPCSVLIPARNEEDNIGPALQSVLHNRQTLLEVLVFDDQSTDATAAVVQEMARLDDRIRLVRSSALPGGWCGKQYACHVLSETARFPCLVFMDADVRLSQDALARMRGYLQQSGAALISGFPAQETCTFSERLLIPLIHFVLLGFLPLRRMRSSNQPALAAGCGQLFLAQREAYRQCGGHRAISASLHDGLSLPRLFRTAGFMTDVFDATDLAECRMYRSNAEVWRGLSRSAHLGHGSLLLLGFATALLWGGQVLPFVLLASGIFRSLPAPATTLAGLAVVLAYLPRALGLKKFRQNLLGAFLHPVGVSALLFIQWFAFFREQFGIARYWKERAYSAR